MSLLDSLFCTWHVWSGMRRSDDRLIRFAGTLVRILDWWIRWLSPGLTSNVVSESLPLCRCFSLYLCDFFHNFAYHLTFVQLRDRIEESLGSSPSPQGFQLSWVWLSGRGGGNLSIEAGHAAKCLTPRERRPKRLKKTPSWCSIPGQQTFHGGGSRKIASSLDKIRRRNHGRVNEVGI